MEMNNLKERNQKRILRSKLKYMLEQEFPFVCSNLSKYEIKQIMHNEKKRQLSMGKLPTLNALEEKIKKQRENRMGNTLPSDDSNFKKL